MSNYSRSSFDASNTNSAWYKAFHLIPPKSLVLDVGCSSGNFGAELIARRGCIVDGIEVEPGDAKTAAKKLRKVYSLDVEKNDLSSIKEKYGVIYFGDVIEHLVDPPKTLKKLKPFLKQDGKIVFSIPNMAHATIRLLLLKGNFEHTETGLLDKTHLHFYNLREVERVFNEAGYSVDNVDFVKKDYPNSLIDKNLEDIGLTASKKFYELMHQPEAAAFQFVGSAVVGKSAKNFKREQFGPIDLFESYYNDTVRSYEDKLSHKADELQKSNVHAKKLQSELDNIFSSKGWAYVTRLRKIKNFFLR